METCGLYLGRREVGRVHWTSTGDRLTVVCSCPYEAGMIYRVILQTDGALHRLGVMLPEDQNFVLRRELPAGSMPHAAFVDRTLPGEAHLPGLPLAFSAFEQDTSEENVLECAVAGTLLCGDWIHTRYLLFPLMPGESCCVASLLCIATPLLYNGALYGVICRQGTQYRTISDTLRRGDMVW